VPTYRIGFLMSQNLGHVVHDQRLRREVAKHGDISPVWMPIPPWSDDRWQRLPIIKNNLTLLSGFRAREHLRRHAEPFDALYCHTQEAALLIPEHMRRAPTILSLDATPKNIDPIGRAYGHAVGPLLVERMKNFLTRGSFQRATHLVTFSHWAKNSLVTDYCIPEERVTVNHPGVDLQQWTLQEANRIASREDLVPRVLFVGTDFRRKGGEVLVRSAARMRGSWAVDIVTREPVPEAETIPGVRIHRTVKPDTAELLALYGGANIFALPTLADTFGLAIIEAMAAQLPVVATRVGAIPEIVVHGETGLLIPANSPEALIEAIEELGRNSERRRAMGIAGRRRVERYFNGAKTYGELVELIKSIAAGKAPKHTRLAPAGSESNLPH
jgi:glycosyltransferase involved in cell wall biosynthesis